MASAQPAPAQARPSELHDTSAAQPMPSTSDDNEGLTPGTTAGPSSSSTTTTTASEATPTTPGDAPTSEVPANGAHRGHAMSIGNAASLFGGAGGGGGEAEDSGTSDLFGAADATSSGLGSGGGPASDEKPSATSGDGHGTGGTSGGGRGPSPLFGPASTKSPFEAINEGDEGAAVEDNTADLFGGSGGGDGDAAPASSEIDWLKPAAGSSSSFGGATSEQQSAEMGMGTGTAGQSYDAGMQYQQQQQYYQGQSAQYAYGDQQQYPQVQQYSASEYSAPSQTASYPQDGTAGYEGSATPSQYAYYDPQQQQQQQYAGGFGQQQSSAMYWDPNQQQQYQQGLQSQAHSASYGDQQGAYQPPAQPQGWNASSAAPYPSSSSASSSGYYPQQQRLATSYQPYQQQGQNYQGASGYDYTSQGNQTTTLSQTPYSAPASSMYQNQMSQSQSRSNSSAPTYATSYSGSYDPYAPPASNDPYSQPASKQPALTHSHTSPYTSSVPSFPNLSHSQTTTSVPQTNDPSGSAAPGSSSTSGSGKLNRAASSFFADLPPIPTKSRPNSAMGEGRRQQAVPPPFSQISQQRKSQPTPPPPPKSRTPAPTTVTQPSIIPPPPPRPSSASSNASYNAGGYRSSSRTAQRQDSYASHTGYSTRSSLDQQSYAQPPSQFQQVPQARPSSAYSNRSSTDQYQQQPSAQQIGYGVPHQAQPPPVSSQPQCSYGQDAAYQGPWQPNSFVASPRSSLDQAGPALHSAQQSNVYSSNSNDRPQQSNEGHSQTTRQDWSRDQLQHQDSFPDSQVKEEEKPDMLYDREPTERQVVAELQKEVRADSEVDQLTAAFQQQTIKTESQDIEIKDEEMDTTLSQIPVPDLDESNKLPIATDHQQVDTLPVHADLAEPPIAKTLEPYERTITLDAYLPPSPRPRHEDGPMNAGFFSTLPPPPTLSVSAPSPETKAVPEDSLASYDESGKGHQRLFEEDSKFPSAQEQEAEIELERAEKELDRELFAEEATELDMLQDVKPPASQVEDPYRSYDINAQGAYQPTASSYSQSLPRSNTSHPSYNDSFSQSSASEYEPHTQAAPYGTSPQDTYGAYESQPNGTHGGVDVLGYGQQPSLQQINRSHSPYGAYSQHSDANQGSVAYPAYGDAQGYDTYGQQEQIPSQPAVAPAVEASPYNPYAPSSTRTDQGYSITPSSSIPNGLGGASAHRTSRPPVPVASFGFNGRLVTFFPSTSSSTSGSAAYSSPYGDNTGSQTSGHSVSIRKLADLLPTDFANLNAFPGPLFMDSTASTASGKSKKKKEVLAWLEQAVDDADKEIGYLGPASSEAKLGDAKAKAVLLKLVKIMLENDGKLNGSPKTDEAISQALVPGLQTNDGTGLLPMAAEIGRTSSSHSDMGTAPIHSTASAQPGDLKTLQKHLLQGDKRGAVQYALNNKLWAHALAIAAGVDQELQAAVTREFIQAELSSNTAQLGTGYEPLKIAYCLFSGAGASSVQCLFPPRSLLQHKSSAPTLSLSASPANTYAPPSRTSTPALEIPADVPASTLAKWQESAAIILANRGNGDAAALTSLGDTLAANGWVKAAHCCYLLSPTTSPLGGPGLPGTRYSLVGSASPLAQLTAPKGIDAVMLSEIVEFALSFVPAVKGQEAYMGLPHLQAYRYLHALELVEAGEHAKAQKYCDAIGATLKLALKGSPFYHPVLLSQVKGLSDRLSNVSFKDKSGSWISRKVQKPTLDNVWSTLEGRFTKFVAGEAEEDPVEVTRRKQAEEAAKVVAGPFAHYSSITPAGSDSISRAPSATDFTRTTPPPQPTSVPNTVSRTAVQASGHHRRSSSYSYGPYGADPYLPYVPSVSEPLAEEAEQVQNEPSQSQQTYDAPQWGYSAQNDQGWWGASDNGTESSTAAKPQFYSTADSDSYAPGQTGHDDFMSPMAYTSQSTSFDNGHAGQASARRDTAAMEDDDDDLGLGNFSNKKKKEQQQQQQQQQQESSGTESPAGNKATKEQTSESEKKEEPAKPAASSSWFGFGRMFRREGSSPASGPIKAKLGEETSFVYDPVEKRWVNKKAGAETPAPSVPAPPPRAQTASPSLAGGSSSSNSSTFPGPPPPSSKSVGPTPPMSRTGTLPALSASTPPSATAAGTAPSANTPPPPSSGPPSKSSTPAPSGELPPPAPRRAGGGGAAARKNVRSRYVDVFAQQQGGA